jgi:hypothetical protein
MNSTRQIGVIKPAKAVTANVIQGDISCLTAIRATIVPINASSIRMTTEYWSEKMSPSRWRKYVDMKNALVLPTSAPRKITRLRVGLAGLGTRTAGVLSSFRIKIIPFYYENNRQAKHSHPIHWVSSGVASRVVVHLNRSRDSDRYRRENPASRHCVDHNRTVP